MSACISCWICATIESVLDDMAMLLRHNRWVVLPIIAQSRRPFNATTFICRFRMRRHGLWSHSNETLVLLQRAANAGCASMWAMHSEATTTLSAAPAAPTRRVGRLQADLTTVRVELATVRAECDQLRGVLADLLAEQVQLRTQLAQTQAQLAAVEAERQATRQELIDLKCARFVARQRHPDDAAPAKPRGRP